MGVLTMRRQIKILTVLELRCLDSVNARQRTLVMATAGALSYGLNALGLSKVVPTRLAVIAAIVVFFYRCAARRRRALSQKRL